MSFELAITVSIIFVTIFASVILLKFWMDFKLEVWDREDHAIHQRYHPVSKTRKHRSNSRNKLYNKKQSEDIIIDVEVEVINEEKSKECVYVQKERLLK